MWSFWGYDLVLSLRVVCVCVIASCYLFVIVVLFLCSVLSLCGEFSVLPFILFVVAPGFCTAAEVIDGVVSKRTVGYASSVRDPNELESQPT